MTFSPERSRAIRAGLIKEVAARSPGYRRPLLVAAVSVGAVALVAGFLVPALLSGAVPIVGVPATPTPSPLTEPAPTPTPDTPTPVPSSSAGTTPPADLATITVSTKGWKTFSSPEYPITFMYPKDWTLSFPKPLKEDWLTSAPPVDGCDTIGCAVYVTPPGQAKEGDGFMVLMRAGVTVGYVPDARYDMGTVLTTVPDLKLWTSPGQTAPATAVIVTRSVQGRCSGPTCTPEIPARFGPPDDYMLSTAELAFPVAAGETNPLVTQPLASFTFEGNRALTAKEPKVVATILASSRPNPGFNPTLPEKDSHGRYKFWTYDSMAAPKPGVDSSTWKTLKVPDGNVSVRVPPKWTIRKGGKDMEGIIWLKAPSGYIIDVLTNAQAEMGCQVKAEWDGPSESLGTLPGVTGTDVDGVSRPVELWWADATWHPAQVKLSLTHPGDGNTLCTQSTIDYGGKHPVYVGSADNSKNPTPAELDQAVAILASLRPLK